MSSDSQPPRPRALFVTISYPPLAESQTIRNVYLIRGLLRAGWEVDVITPAFSGGDPAVLEFLGGNVTVYRTKLPLFDRVMERLSVRSRIPLLRYVRSAFAVAWGKMTVPDIRSDWAEPAQREIERRCTENRYALLISSSGSNTAHRAVARAVERFSIPWLAEYGDPWALNPIPPASLPRIRDKNMKLERAALRACSGMTVTTHETKALYRDWLKGECPPIEVVPCGFDAGLRKSFPSSRSVGARKSITFAYVGSASRGNRDLRELMVVLDQIGMARPNLDLGLRVVGSFSPFFSHVSSELKHLSVTYSGWVTYERSIREIGDTDVLVLYGNRSKVQIPGKVFPYLASGRPIVYVAQMDLEDDPTWKLVRAFGGLSALRKGDPHWAEQLGTQIDRLKEWEMSASSRFEDPALGQYEWNSVADRFASFARDTAARERS